MRIGDRVGRTIIVPGGAAGGAGITNINVSAGTTSNNLSNLTFADSPTVSFGLDGSTITASAAGGGAPATLAHPVASANSVGTAPRVALEDHRHAGVFSMGASNVGNTAGDTRVDVGRFVLAGGNNVTLSQATAANALNTISIVGATLTNSSWTVSDNATSGTVARLAFTNLNGVTLSLSSGAAGQHTIVGSHNALTSQSNQAFSAAGGSSAFQTLSFSDNAYLSWTNNAGQVAVTEIRGSFFATGNTTQSSSNTINLDTVIFRGSGAASVGVSNGSIIVDVQAGAAAITQSIGMSTQTAGGATAGTTGYATGDDILYHFVPGSNITMSQSIDGASGTLSVYGPAGNTLSAPSLGIFNNLNAAGDSVGEPRRSFVFAGSHRSLAIYPLVAAPWGGPFPGDLTCNTFYYRMSLSGSTATMSQAFTSTFRIGIYTQNASSLSLLNSVEVTFGSGAANANLSTLFVGNRYLTIDATAWSSSPVFRFGSIYYIATNHDTAGVSNQTGQFSGGYIWASNSLSHSGTIGVATANNTTMGLHPWIGMWSATTNAFPVSIASNAVNKQSPIVVVPPLILNQNNPASF